MNLGTIGALLFVALSGRTMACQNVCPDLESGAYSSVFLGNVTAIHFVGYEKSLQGIPEFEPFGVGVRITEDSREVVVTAVPTLIVSGAVKGPVTVRLAGCTTHLPELKERGIFFLGAGKKSADTVCESSSDDFTKAMKMLKIIEHVEYIQ